MLTNGSQLPVKTVVPTLDLIKTQRTKMKLNQYCLKNLGFHISFFSLKSWHKNMFDWAKVINLYSDEKLLWVSVVQVTQLSIKPLNLNEFSVWFVSDTFLSLFSFYRYSTLWTSSFFNKNRSVSNCFLFKCQAVNRYQRSRLMEENIHRCFKCINLIIMKCQESEIIYFVGTLYIFDNYF